MENQNPEEGYLLLHQNGAAGWPIRTAQTLYDPTRLVPFNQIRLASTR